MCIHFRAWCVYTSKKCPSRVCAFCVVKETYRKDLSLCDVYTLSAWCVYTSKKCPSRVYTKKVCFECKVCTHHTEIGLFCRSLLIHEESVLQVWQCLWCVCMKKVCFECIRNAKMFCGFFAVNTFECTAKKQRTVIYCNKLQHTVTTASYCNTLQHTATLQWKTSLRADEYFTCDTLQHTATHC